LADGAEAGAEGFAVGAEGFAAGVLVGAAFGAPGGVADGGAAATTVLAQRRAHASARANEGLRLICGQILSRLSRFGHGRGHGRRESGRKLACRRSTQR
jgi:hypothetical protein